MARITDKKSRTPKGDGGGNAERRQTTVYLPNDQYRALKVYAAQHDKEMSAVVSEALRKFGIG